MVGINKKSENLLKFPLVFTVIYTPAVAQISVRGTAHVTELKDELKKIHDEHAEKRPPASVVVQSIYNAVLLESVIITRTLNISLHIILL